MSREYSKSINGKMLKAFAIGIEIIAIDGKIIEKSQELREKYSNLNIFDSIHVACAIVHNEILISTDKLFSNIKELNSKDPREFKENNKELDKESEDSNSLAL